MKRVLLLLCCLALGGAASCNREGNEALARVRDRLPAPRADLPLGPPGERMAVFASGCFWCTEAVFEELAGVSAVVSGYAGGTAESARYGLVARGKTGHAEAVQVTYDPSKITYGTLLWVFFATHNPTQLNRQGPDVGRQYRSAVFYATEDEKRLAAAYIAQLDAAEVFKKPIATTLEPLEGFYTAESYHQDYARRNPDQGYIRFQARPKVKKVKKLFPELTGK